MNQANHPGGYSDFTHVDDRCVGGKTLIMHHMKNHYDKLVDTKPQLKIEEPKRYIHENRKPRHTLKDKRVDPYLDVKVAFRKVANTKKGYVDHKAPISVQLNMKDQLKGRYKRGNKYLDEAHQLHHEALQKKLQKKGKAMKDRMKDDQDCIAHPVKFFRRRKELPHKKIEYLTNLPAGNRLVVTEEDGQLKSRFDKGMDLKNSIHQPIQGLNQNGRVSTAHSRLQQRQGNNGAQNGGSTGYPFEMEGQMTGDCANPNAKSSGRASSAYSKLD